ncbi:GNAT family N-acetyltransferase [Gemmobacter serpentinus]|uniref:GNAT family N-acetyltransferase n=1 Tax=Gemmobacter serpentinus TaxID=2652247 RepID=UPI00124DEC06|nr:GNAT family protein [Gemmobacter serpentinus]
MVVEATGDLAHFAPAPHPSGVVLEGSYTRLEPLDGEAHAADLYRAVAGEDGLWTFMPYGPFAGAAAYHRWVKDRETSRDPVFVAIRDLETGHVGGVAAFLRIDQANGVIEVGHICLAPELQKTRAATEAMFLMMQWAFAMGYRRFEWKCDARNLPSRRAAQRLGFSFEGIFRQHLIVKGQNRDTAWFSVIDSEWPGLDEAFRAWLAPANFSDGGRQRERLSDLTQLVRAASDPAL